MSQTLPPAPDFSEASLEKALIAVRQMKDGRSAKICYNPTKVVFQPEPTNYSMSTDSYTSKPVFRAGDVVTVFNDSDKPIQVYDQNAAQQAALAGMTLLQHQQMQDQYQAALRQVVTNQPDYDINTQSVSRLLHEEILANQVKSYEMKLNAMRREIAALNLALQESRVLANTLISAQQAKNPTTAAPTTTKTTPFPLNALTNQTQRIGLTTERYL